MGGILSQSPLVGILSQQLSPQDLQRFLQMMNRPSLGRVNGGLLSPTNLPRTTPAPWIGVRG